MGEDPALEPHGRHHGSGGAPRPTSRAESVPGRGGEPERLWREAVGEQIRRIRTDRAERLTDVAERSGISPQYLSEIERGLKDPSSELLAAVAGALGTNVEGLVRRAYHRAPMIRLAPPAQPSPRHVPAGPVCMAA